MSARQRWSRGHKARGQDKGHKKIRGQGQPFRGQTLSRPRAGMLEAKDQGHKCKCSQKKRSSNIFFRRSQKRKGKVFKFFFSGDLRKKGLQNNFSGVIQQKCLLNFFFQAIYKVSTIQKKVLSSSRGQANYRGLEASRPRPRT